MRFYIDGNHFIEASDEAAALAIYEKQVAEDYARIAAMPKPEKPQTIAQLIKDAQVFEFHADGDGVEFAECCDGYYSIRLSKEQLTGLINELSALRDALP